MAARVSTPGGSRLARSWGDPASLDTVRTYRSVAVSASERCRVPPRPGAHTRQVATLEGWRANRFRIANESVAPRSAGEPAGASRERARRGARGTCRAVPADPMQRETPKDRSTTLLDTEQERNLIASFRAGSRTSLQRLIHSHMPLVRSIARRYRGHARHDDDLIAEGRLGLLQAAQRFEPERGVRFAVYAAWWVRAFVRRYALDNRRIVRAPSTRMGRKLASKLPSTMQRLRQTCGREATDDELAGALEAPVDEVSSVRLALSTPDLMLDDESARVGALVDPSASPEQEAADRERLRRIKERIARALEFLSTREREIVERRYLDDDGATLATLGARLGISRERVRQLESRARDKLREHLVDVA